MAIILPYRFTEDQSLESPLFLSDILRLLPGKPLLFSGSGSIRGNPTQCGRVFSQPM